MSYELPPPRSLWPGLGIRVQYRLNSFIELCVNHPQFRVLTMELHAAGNPFPKRYGANKLRHQGFDLGVIQDEAVRFITQ